MKFVELSVKEFKDFSIVHPLKNFFQSVYMYEMYKVEKAESYLVGMKNAKNKVVCASLIVTKDKGKHKTFEASKGFLIDYNDKLLLKEFTKHVKSFIKDKGGFRLVIDPYFPIVQRDSDAAIVENGFSNEKMFQNIIDNNFIPREKNAQVKWTYCLDINGKTSQELFNEMKPNTKNYINRTQSKYNLSVRTLKFDEIKEFKQITVDTCRRRSFSDKTLEYYENMYKCFKDKIVFKVVELNCDAYIKVLENKINNHRAKIEASTRQFVSKAQNRNEQLLKEITENEEKVKEYEKLKNDKGNIITLAGAMFMLYGDEVIYLFSGSYDEYMSFGGQYLIQWEMIKYAADNNYKRYNFFGIRDVFNKNGKDYGVYQFKKGFGGYVEELVGSFEIGVTPYYWIYTKLRTIRGIIKK